MKRVSGMVNISTLFICLAAGLIFLSEGLQKYLLAAQQAQEDFQRLVILI